MKTIIIEQVTNGWIVRPFQLVPDYAVRANCDVNVYRAIEELQEALPSLLKDITQETKP